MWIVFALANSAFSAVTNILDKILSDRYIKNPFAFARITGLMFPLFSLGIYIFHGIVFPGWQVLFWSLLVGAGFVFSDYFYFKSLMIEDVSTVIPFFQFVPVFSLLLTLVFLHESLTIMEVASFILILAGGLLLSSDYQTSKGAFRIRKVFWFMICSSFIYGVLAILIKLSSRSADVWNILAYEYLGSGLTSILFLILPGSFKSFRSELKQQNIRSFLLISCSCVIYFVAIAFLNFALSLGPVPLVVVLGGTQPFFILIFSAVFTFTFPHILREEFSKSVLFQKAISLILITSGIILMQSKFG